MKKDHEQGELLSQPYVPVCAIGASAGGIAALRDSFGCSRRPRLCLCRDHSISRPISPSASAKFSLAAPACPCCDRGRTDSPAQSRLRHSARPRARHRRRQRHGPSLQRAARTPGAHRPVLSLCRRRAGRRRRHHPVGCRRGRSRRGARYQGGGRRHHGAGAGRGRFLLHAAERHRHGRRRLRRAGRASGERLAEVARSKEAVRSLDADGSANDLRRIVAFLRARTGHDFSGYKRATIMRRVSAECRSAAPNSLATYADYLLTTPEEIKELLSDLLISVTSFFREPRVVRARGRACIKPLFDELDPEKEEGIRAWVVGCATGEEAYSLAMLLLEEAGRRKLRPPIQIFASDLDEGALATAREGRYPRSIEADVSEERLARFFVDEGTHYRVRKRGARVRAVRAPQRDQGPAVHAAGPDLLPQPADLPRAQPAAATLLDLSLQPQAGALSVSRVGRDGGRRRRLVLAAGRGTPGSTQRGSGSRAALPILPQLAGPDRTAIGGQQGQARAVRSDAPVALHLSALEQNAPASALVDTGRMSCTCRPMPAVSSCCPPGRSPPP